MENEKVVVRAAPRVTGAEGTTDGTTEGDDLKERLARAIYRISEEAWGEGDAPNHSLEHELQIFLGEVMAGLAAMPSHEAMAWLWQHIREIEHLHARTGKERWHALRSLVALRGGLSNVADLLEEIAAPAPANAPTEGTTTTESDDDDDEGDFHAPAVREIVAAYRHTAMSQRDLLLERLRGACARLGGEAACTARGHPWGRGLNAGLGQFVGRAEFCLRGICPIDAQAWLEGNVGELEGLHARNRQEYNQAELVLSGLSDRLFGLLYDLARER